MANNIAIITARGGSKRIPRKNIKQFLGYPIIKYSIDAALGSECFDEVMVSTDDREIAEVSTILGAQVPFFRSASCSDDFSTTADVLLEVLLEYRKLGREFDQVCCIYPTAPFVTQEKLKLGMQTLLERNADCVLPVVQFNYPIERCLRIDDNIVRMDHPENYLTRSQDFAPAYHDAGQFYCLNTESFLVQRKLFPKYTIPLIMPSLEVQDIDNSEDWELAELKYKFLYKI